MSSPVRHQGGRAQSRRTATRRAACGCGRQRDGRRSHTALSSPCAQPSRWWRWCRRNAAGDETLPCGRFLPGEHAYPGRRACAPGCMRRPASNSASSSNCARCGAPSRTRRPMSRHLVSVSYLALVGPQQCSDRTRATWRSWYGFFPWEDWRNGRPDCLNEIEPRLEAWAARPEPSCPARWMPDRRQRVRITFGWCGRDLGRGEGARALRAALRGGHRRRGHGGRVRPASRSACPG